MSLRSTFLRAVGSKKLKTSFSVYPGKLFISVPTFPMKWYLLIVSVSTKGSNRHIIFSLPIGIFISLLVFFTRLIHIPLGFPSIIIAHIVFCSPLAVFIILGRMQRFDWSWEEAALDLGATPFRTFMRVTGPQLMPAIMASAMLIFPWSFDDFVITYFVAGVGSTTLPIYVFSQLRFGSTPVINTIGTLFVAVTMLGILLVYLVQRKTKTSG